MMHGMADAWLALNTAGEPREKQVSHDLSRPRRLVLLRAPSQERLFPFRRLQTGIIRALFPVRH